MICLGQSQAHHGMLRFLSCRSRAQWWWIWSSSALQTLRICCLRRSCNKKASVRQFRNRRILFLQAREWISAFIARKCWTNVSNMNIFICHIWLTSRTKWSRSTRRPITGRAWYGRESTGISEMLWFQYCPQFLTHEHYLLNVQLKHKALNSQGENKWDDQQIQSMFQAGKNCKLNLLLALQEGKHQLPSEFCAKCTDA
jgi:hypothetical protein